MRRVVGVRVRLCACADRCVLAARASQCGKRHASEPRWPLTFGCLREQRLRLERQRVHHRIQRSQVLRKIHLVNRGAHIGGWETTKGTACSNEPACASRQRPRSAAAAVAVLLTNLHGHTLGLLGHSQNLLKSVHHRGQRGEEQ